MEFKTHNDKLYIDTDGTHLQGKVIVDYPLLKKLFGKPTPSDEDKSDAEWEVEFEDGVVATIYNYKDGKNYKGKEGIATTKLTNWHIGGKDQKAVDNVVNLIKAELPKEFNVDFSYFNI